MGAGNRAGAALGVALVCGLSACGGGGASDEDRAREGAEAVVRRLADTASGEATAACRTLTLATRRVVGRLSPEGGTCSTALSGFASTFGLDPQLSRAGEISATVRGDRASVVVEGLAGPLTAVRTGDQWRVSLIGLPGVRGDLAAAEACGTYVRAADGLPLPPGDRAGAARLLERQRRLLGTFRRRLAALPAGGPSRSVAQLTRTLRDAERELRTSATRLRGGGGLQSGQVAGAFVDRGVRGLLGYAAVPARIVCPADVTESTGAYDVRTAVERRCRAFRGTLARLNDAEPATRAALTANLAERQRLLRSLQAGLKPPGAAALPAPLRRVRAGAVAAARDLIGTLEELKAADTLEEYEAIADRGTPRAGPLDAGLERLGITCEASPAAPAAAPGRTVQN